MIIKLIKELPWIPVGTIGRIQTDKPNPNYTMYKFSNWNTSSSFSFKRIEKHPEFFKIEESKKWYDIETKNIESWEVFMVWQDKFILLKLK